MKTNDQLLVILDEKNMKGIIPKLVIRNFNKIVVVKTVVNLNKAVLIAL